MRVSLRKTQGSWMDRNILLYRGRSGFLFFLFYFSYIVVVIYACSNKLVIIMIRTNFIFLTRYDRERVMDIEKKDATAKQNNQKN